ncbi:innexin unc-9-like [Babylonia areolata]|uniref:innexin unc-9-like n=1 Tax=Babylonia areolata TaxID=304850 RepID=UPI003FD36846
MSMLSFASFAKLQGARDDDWADRTSHLYTVVLLCIFTAMVSSAQYVGDPINCWCPAEFPSFHVSYTKSICWISNTYFLPTDNLIPKDIDRRQEGEITYYQWVPIIFLFMALLFKTPNVIWRLGHSYSGLNMEKVISMAEKTQQVDSHEERDTKLQNLAKYLDCWLYTYRHYRYNMIVRVRQKLAGVFCFWLSKRDGSFLMGFYLFVKLLYCINIVVQFFLLNAFLSMEYNVFGFEVLDRIRRGEDAVHNARFPRVTLCDFLIRQMTNVHRYTVQCVLSINLFNEKIFIVLWFWLFLVAILSWSNLAHWFFWVLVKENKVSYVKKYLKLTDQIHTSKDKILCRKFANEYLRDDGIFVLRVVGLNSSELALKDLILKLWKTFNTNYSLGEPGRERRPSDVALNGDVEDNDDAATDVAV